MDWGKGILIEEGKRKKNVPESKESLDIVGTALSNSQNAGAFHQHCSSHKSKTRYQMGCCEGV